MVEDYYLLIRCMDPAPSIHSIIYRQSLDDHTGSLKSMIHLLHWHFQEVKKKKNTIRPYHHTYLLRDMYHERPEHHQQERPRFFRVQRGGLHELSENTMLFLFLDFS
jgi:hypothetical protein